MKAFESNIDFVNFKFGEDNPGSNVDFEFERGKNWSERELKGGYFKHLDLGKIP